MHKQEMIKAVADKEGLTQAVVERIIMETIRLITRAIQVEGRCEVAGFGVFKKFRSAAVSRPSPQDRTKIIDTPARNTVKFKPSPALKEAVQ